MYKRYEQVINSQKKCPKSRWGKKHNLFLVFRELKIKIMRSHPLSHQTDKLLKRRLPVPQRYGEIKPLKKKFSTIKNVNVPSMVAHTCNPSCSGGGIWRITV
jgi:hypothetical protein